MQKPIVWTIAGSDSSACAGVQADLKTFSALGVQACSVITGVTAQNQQKLSDIQFIDIEPQIAVLCEEHLPGAVKIGMLGKKSSVEVVSKFLQQHAIPAILDPVLISTSGGQLFSNDNLNFIEYFASLFPYIELLTPNIPETEILLQRRIMNFDDIEQAAMDLLALGIKSVLIKGGHCADDHFSQDYWTDGVDAFWLVSERKQIRNFRGTGCILSSAIAAARAQGNALQDAIVIGKMVINQAMDMVVNNDLWHADYLPLMQVKPMAQLCDAFPAAEPIGLYPIVDDLKWLKILLPLGVKTIQLRIKDAEKIRQCIQEALHIAKQYDARLFINDHWQLAIACGAYGVHLGQEDLQTADIAAIRAAGLRLGLSTHGYAELAKAMTLQPSYIAFGAIYATTLKPLLPQGIEQLKRWRKMVRYPLVAIGGINLQRTPEIIATGVDGVAMISAITQAENPIAITQALLAMINQPKLSASEMHRYQQQIKLNNIGIKGQMKLKNARVLCVGAGGLASPLLMYLAAAGVGTIGIIDSDQLELSNLQRQILYHTRDVGGHKVWLAKQNLLALNPDIKIEVYPVRLQNENAHDLIARYDIVADCTDNFLTKYLVNAVCYQLHKPFVYASVSQYLGQYALFDGKQFPCFACLFPDASTTLPDCAEGGIIGVLPGLLGTLQATVILKWLLNLENSLGKMLTVNLLSFEFDQYQLTPNPACKVCQQQHARTKLEITLIELQQKIYSGEKFTLVDVRSAIEHETNNLGGLLIPLSELPHRLSELNPQEEIILYCQSGKRSAIAAEILRKANFKNVLRLIEQLEQ